MLLYEETVSGIHDDMVGGERERTCGDTAAAAAAAELAPRLEEALHPLGGGEASRRPPQQVGSS